MVKNSIKVYARLKKEDERKKVVKYQIYRRADAEDISFPVNSATDATQKNRKYRFCKVFDQVTTQVDVFSTVAQPIINSVINGFNGTIFAYGQTGSGKTYSITGSPTEYNERGVLPRSIEQIFELTKTTPNLYNIYVSYLEIYNENGYDLLNSKCQPSRLEELPRVVLLEDAHGEAHLRNLSVLPVTNEQEAMRLLFLGDTNRTIAETPMNEYSSRSHCIFTVYVHSRNENGGKLRRSKLHLVDLAGSERICKAKISGVALREAKHINLSLHYLEQVILALSQSNRTHIPYRNSMMTYILRDSLSGNSLTIMLATLALTEQNHPETLTTCKFAQRVACISTEAIINEEVDPQQEIEYLRAEVDELRKQLTQAKGENTLHKALTYEDKEKCKKCADNFFFGGNEHLPDKLTNAELRYCLRHLKSSVMDKLSDRVEKQKLEDDINTMLNSKYSTTIKEKDEEISVLTQLLQMNDHVAGEKQRTNSAPACSTTSPYADLKLQLPLSEYDLFDTFVMDKANTDDITQIKKSLRNKYDLARNVSKTVEKCQENIGDIRQKLSKERMGSEISEKLHSFLVSQQKIYKQSLGQLEDLKSETDFLKEGLKQAENKVMRKFKSAVKAKHKRDDENNRHWNELDDFWQKQSGHSYYTAVKIASDTDINEKRNNGNQFCECHMKLTKNSKRSDMKTCYSKICDFLPNVDEEIPPSDCTNYLLYIDKYHETSTRPSSKGDEGLLESTVYSTKSGISSGCATTSDGNEKIQAEHDEGMESLCKSSDTPQFIEFMKTIPLTGDLEVDDEIFNFYRTKFKH